MKLLRITYLSLCLVFASANAQNTLYFSSAQKLFNEGYQLYQSQKYNAAINTFEQFIKEFPNDKKESAQYYIASSHLNLVHSVGESYLLTFIENNPQHFLVSNAYFDLANYFYTQNKYDKAIQYFIYVDKDLLENEQVSELNFKLAYSYFASKNFKDALALFERARLRQNKYQSASAYYAAFIYLEEKKWQNAYDILLTLENDESYENNIPAMLMKALYNLEKWDELIKYGSKIIQSKQKITNAEQVDLYLGLAYFNKKDYKNTIDNLNNYIKIVNIIEREISFSLGYSFYKEKIYDEAVNNLKNAMIPDDSLSQVCAYYLGASYLELKQKKYAINAFKQASDLEFSKEIKEEALYIYGKINFEIGDNSNTIISFSKLLTEFPNTKYENETKEIISEAYLKSDNYEDALSYLGSIKNKYEYIKKAYQNAAFMLAIKYYNCGDFEQTELYLDKAFVYPIDEEIKASSYYLRGEMLSQQKQTNLAILAYSGVFQSDTKRNSPYYLKSRLGIAYQYYNNKEFNRALAHFQYYVENAKEKDNFYFNAKIRLADCFYINKSYTEASKYYEEAATESKHLNDYTLFQSGVLNYLQGNAEKSKAFYRSLAQQYPNSGYADNALYQTAIVDFEKANYIESIKDFQQLISTYPNSSLIPFALEKNGIANTNIGNYKNAKQSFIDIIENYPRHKSAKSAIFSLQDVLNKLGQSNQFEMYLAKYKLANPDDNDVQNIEFENAKNLFVEQKYQQASTEFENFITTYSNSILISDAKYYLAESYNKLNQTEKAILFYEEVIKENKSFFTSKAIFECAELYFKNELYAKANDMYAHLVTYSTQNKDKVKGYLGQMYSANALNSAEGTILFAQKVISNASVRNKDRDIAYLYKGKSELILGNDSTALNNFRFIVQNSTFEIGAEANYRIAEYYYKKQKNKESIVQLRLLNQNYASFDFWLGKSFLLIADNYIAMSELFQAKATLKSIVENSQTKEIVAEANLKLQFLEQEGMQMNSDTLKSIKEIQPALDTLNNEENEK